MNGRGQLLENLKENMANIMKHYEKSQHSVVIVCYLSELQKRFDP